jgi:hypothetical protein
MRRVSGHFHAALRRKKYKHLSGILMNYYGIYPVPPKLFLNAASVFARACLGPAAGIRRIKNPAERCEEHLPDLWLYSRPVPGRWLPQRRPYLMTAEVPVIPQIKPEVCKTTGLAGENSNRTAKCSVVDFNLRKGVSCAPPLKVCCFRPAGKNMLVTGRNLTSEENIPGGDVRKSLPFSL